MPGALIAFEGLDQSGKQTQADALRQGLGDAGHRVELLAFPDYRTAIGAEIQRALRGEREYAPDVMQLLYVANRYELKDRLSTWLAAGAVVLCDRYLASSVAYGEAQGLDAAWLLDIQRFLPRPALTVLLDIEPEAAARRKAADRDLYERDLALLGRVRESYLTQAARGGWIVVDGDRPREEVSRDVRAAVSRLGLL